MMFLYSAEKYYFRVHPKFAYQNSPPFEFCYAQSLPPLQRTSGGNKEFINCKSKKSHAPKIWNAPILFN